MTSPRIMNPAILVALVPFTWLIRHFWWTCDDAFISFRYVRHWVGGEGLIFNPGEAPPVEGFTNLLWVLVLGPLWKADVSLPVAANLLSSACGVALLALLVHQLRQRRMHPSITVMAGLFFVTLPPVAIWATSGLETMPFALAIFGVYVYLVQGKGALRIIGATLVAVLAALLRADGALWCGFAFLAALASCDREQRSAMWRTVLSVGVLLTLAVGAHFVWRHAYFGEWMPNTAKVKAGFSMLRAERGAKYLLSLVLAVPALGLLPLVGLVFLRTLRERAGLGLGALTFVLCAGTYAIFVGGDFMAMGRFLVPAMPFLALLLAALGESLERSAVAVSASAVLVILGLVGCFDRLPIPGSVRQAVHFRWNGSQARSEIEQWSFMKQQVVNNRRLGLALANHTQSGESLVRGNVGAVGFYSNIVLLDINGLVTPEVVAAAQPTKRASPGHDLHVAPQFFDDWDPDYLYAAVLPSSVPPRYGFSERWRRMLKAGKLSLERVPLRVEDGFEAGTELRLLRDLRHSTGTTEEVR